MSTPTPPDAEPTPDREERELAALYRQLPAVEPDPALDARVLDQARRAVSRSPRRYRKLLVGFGSAATLVMAAGLTWHMNTHGPGTITHRAAPSPAAAQKSYAPATSPNRQAVPVRILSGARNKKSGASPHAPTPRADDAARAARAAPALAPKRRADKAVPTREVIRVRVLPRAQEKTSASAPLDRAPQAGKARNAASGLTRPRAKAEAMPTPAPGATQMPAGAQALVARARQALAGNDKARTRMLVRDIVQRYPNLALPADLAPFAPHADAGKGSP